MLCRILFSTCIFGTAWFVWMSIKFLWTISFFSGLVTCIAVALLLPNPTLHTGSDGGLCSTAKVVLQLILTPHSKFNIQGAGRIKVERFVILFITLPPSYRPLQPWKNTEDHKHE